MFFAIGANCSLFFFPDSAEEVEEVEEDTFQKYYNL